MLKKRLVNIAKISVLIGIRQGWKWLRNLYLFNNQPYLTMKELVDNRDKSQIFLLGATIVAPMMGYGLTRIVWDKMRYGVVLKSVGPVFVMTIIMEIMMMTFVGYWVYKVKRNKLG